MSTAITIERKKLQEALGIIRENVPETELGEISRYTIFQEGRVHGFNDTTGITIPLGEAIPNCAVEASLLYECIRKMPDKQIKIGITDDGNFRVMGKASKADFPIRNDIIYPEELIQLESKDFTKLPETFERAMILTHFACDADDSSYSRVAMLESKAYGLSDYRVNRFDMGETAAESFQRVVFVTPEALSFINKYSPKKYLISGSWLHLYSNDMKIYSCITRSDSNFPFDLAEDLLSDIDDAEQFMFPATIKDILDRCNPFSGKDAKVKYVTVRIDGAKMRITAVREDGSSYREDSKVEELKNPVMFAISLKALQDIVQHADFFKVNDTKLVAFGTDFVSMIPLRKDDE